MKKIINQGRILGSALLLCVLGSWVQPARGEGSRTLYPASAPANSYRANLEWSTDIYGNLVRRRTLLKVFAKQGEYILMGSSAVTQGSGDILVYKPGKVTGKIGEESIPAIPDFKCSSQSGQGYISSRTQELAGPNSISGNNNPNGYTPCYYAAPTTGVYDIVMYGPSGGNSTTDGGPLGQLNLNDSKNFDTNQKTTIAAWDVTVRSNDPKSTTDVNGRLFSYYFSLFTNNNGLYLNFAVYPVTTDGYQYKVELRGLDPNGFLLFGNQVGFFDSDGKTPLYHDINGDNAQINNPEGGTKLGSPQYATFLNPIDTAVLSYIERYRPDGAFDGTGIPLTPATPSVNTLKFTGTAGGNNNYLGTNGTFTFNSNVAGIYELIISRDGVNFDPTNAQNRVLRGTMITSGGQSVTWNGKDNNGDNFPVGTNYKVRVKVHAGEYHFPMLDAENNFTGGPTITMLNGNNPLGKTRAFYDDRGYKTIGGIQVGTPGTVLCGIGQPNPAFSDPITGFDTTTNDRKFGQSGNAGNANTKCNGSFGDTKGLDLWTYYPSAAEETPLNIVGNISGTLYQDSDGEDDFDSGEPTLPAGITVKLINPSNNNSVVATTTTAADGTYSFTGIANGSYTVQVDPNDAKIPAGMALGTPNNLAVTITGSPVMNKNFGFDVYQVSPSASKVIINEVLYNETGTTADTNDEFIEIYNASNATVDLSGWKLADGNLIANNTDGVDSITGSSSNPAYIFPNGTTLAAGKYAVIWIGNNNANHQASGATFQAWLGQPPKLNNTGDDVSLYDNQNKIVDYIAYGSGSAINTPPPSSLNLWNNTYQSALAGASSGQSISLTKNGIDGNTSACWEPTTSGNAKTQGCANYLPTRNTDSTGKYKTSVGQNNNDVAKLLLVKRITAINGKTSNGSIDMTQVVDDPNTTDDNDPKWPANYLKGAIDGGKVRPGDELEYTIYFLSSGYSAIKNVSICDLVPANTTFVDGSGSGIALAIGSTSPTNLTNADDSDRAKFIVAGTQAPGSCNKAAFSNTTSPPPLPAAQNLTGAVLVDVVKGSTTLPDTPANSPAYGFIRFRVKVK